jgi:hypothetical protein
MPINIVFETTRFSGPDPNAPSGEQLVRWIGEQLQAHGVKTESVRNKEDGWEFGASHGDARYLVIAGLQRDAASVGGNWKISVDKRRSLSDQLFGKNQLSPTDPFVWLVENALQSEPDIKNVRRS